MQLLLENAIVISTWAHKGKLDKGAQPYILHPLRVMLAVDTIEEKIVGVLHDVLEDSPLTINQLREKKFSKKVLEAINLLTKRENQSYENYIQSIKRNRIATNVKIADLLDNMDISRLKQVTLKDKMRLEKYEEAYKYLSKEL